MALHVPGGEFPVFFWGQHYKGVPEVYLSSAVFAVAGASPVSLKAVTLGCFVAAVLAQFVLARRLFGAEVAWTASVFLIAGPPALVHWSLSANAEMVWTLVAGAIIWSAWVAWRRSGSVPALVTATIAAGFGLWVHDYVIYYLTAIAVVELLDQPQLIVGTAWPSPAAGWAGRFQRLLGAAAVVYVLLGAMAFLGSGLVMSVGSVVVSAQNPQKLWSIAAALILVAAGIRCTVWAASAPPAHRRTFLLALGGLLLGSSPLWVYRLLVGGSSPMAEADLFRIVSSAQPIGTTIVPMLFGFRGPDTAPLGVSAWAAVPMAAALVPGFLTAARVHEGRTLSAFALTTPALFLLSGAYVDAQSYRYLMPLYSVIPVFYALGIARVARGRGAVAAALCAALAAVFAWQQVAWYRQLQPDRVAPRLIECLDERGITRAWADYWLSYKLTFLTGERIIVAPINGDRYPPYTSVVHSEANAPMLIAASPDTSGGAGCSAHLQSPGHLAPSGGLTP
jgi:hypothetical protein